MTDDGGIQYHQQLGQQEQQMSEHSSYERLSSINVNDHIERKNGLSYLSWAWAWDQLLRQDPIASVEYHEPVSFGETMMVSCTVTAFGIPRRMHLPVMDHRNKAIPNPDAFQVNTAMQRCMVKAIALHGLGLYIYAGEDLPTGELRETFDVQPYLDSIVAAQTMDELKKLYADGFGAAGDAKDKSAQKQIIAAKDKRKAELTNGTTGSA